MPLGSSSAAPVTMPGPRALRKTSSRESQDGLDFADAARRSLLVAPFLAIPASYPSLRESKRFNILRKICLLTYGVSLFEKETSEEAAGKNYSLYFALWPSFLFALASIFFFSDSDSLPFLTI